MNGSKKEQVFRHFYKTLLDFGKSKVNGGRNRCVSSHRQVDGESGFVLSRAFLPLGRTIISGK
ncbi:hypothetical protein CLV93_107135 [Prolixibacter denitrificans]|uniref:Uncharacterized protein n=1 Tax=Prolixibacter denitrificans TaxID=1541063 RepID=A0A2P8CAM2_9BACT|nr:hypothetical protein CLV93_107135 [Prolixibacter denitrificans]